VSVRQLQCETCGAGKQEGSRIALEASPIELAERERVIWGVARNPQEQQRQMRINGVPIPMPMNAYNCDRCNREINPGARACAWTIWMDGDPEPAAWEDEFLIREVVK
jgi:hypothetical protein